jgi:hypothetical protein
MSLPKKNLKICFLFLFQIFDIKKFKKNSETHSKIGQNLQYKKGKIPIFSQVFGQTSNKF